MRRVPIFFFFPFLLWQCQGEHQNVQLNRSGAAFEKLSEYNFFQSPLYKLSPNKSVLPYDLINPLFSDYAQKARFVWMPEGYSARCLENGELDFPIHTVLIKNFFYKEATHKKKIVETRLLIKKEQGWDPLTYVWNDEQTEAIYTVAGDFKEITAHDEEGEPFTIDYAIPNKNQCKNCHERDRKILPIGPKLQNLNRDFAYEDGLQNQLAKWTQMKYLSDFDPNEVHAAMPSWDDPTTPLPDRARSYLEINCGTCHHKNGSANVSGLHLTVEEKNPFNLGVCKAPVSAGKGSGGNQYDIMPGNPDKSIIVFRMESQEPGAMMPEIGRKLVHKEGVKLIRTWIDNMEGNCP